MLQRRGTNEEHVGPPGECIGRSPGSIWRPGFDTRDTSGKSSGRSFWRNDNFLSDTGRLNARLPVITGTSANSVEYHQVDRRGMRGRENPVVNQLLLNCCCCFTAAVNG
jgi:hypothetical protein